jgi:IS605 OrfB family transposase
LSRFIAADQWGKEDILKTKHVKLNPNKRQRKIIDEWFHTSNYLYNKTIDYVKGKTAINRIELRDQLVTNETKKTHPDYKIASDEILNLHKNLKEEKDFEKKLVVKNLIISKNKELRTLAKSLPKSKNLNVNKRELNTPKEIRADTIFDFVSARKSAISNFKAGHNASFNFNYRKKNRESNCISLQPSLISIQDSKIKIAPGSLRSKSLFNVGKRTLKNLDIDKIEYACRLQKKGGNYHLFIPVKVELNENVSTKKSYVYCGVDPGSRTFLTSFGNTECTEYIFSEAIKKLNSKKTYIKKHKKKRHKKKLNKIDNKKKHITDELHWKSINHLLKNNDIVFFGDIKTHNIVNSKNRTLNRDINDLKFFLFKNRLLYKSKLLRKKVIFVKEHYTTQTCSCCGKLNFPGMSKVYKCNYCKKIIGRDTNAAKNILMKGLIQNEIYW